MSDPSDAGEDANDVSPGDASKASSEDASPADGTPTDESATETPPTDAKNPEELRQQVDEKYDWENFGPREMREISPEEWDVAFDPDSWVTGDALLDRVEKDLRRRVAERDVFAVIEREVETGARADADEEGGVDEGARPETREDARPETREDARPETEEVLVAYADEGFAVVYPDGSVEGSGTVLRDVKPTVALCSMPDYEVVEPPKDAGLPDPDEVPEGGGQLGHRLLQAIAFAQLGFGLLLFVMPFTYDPFVNGCVSIPGTEAHQCVIAGQELVLFPLGSAGVMAAMAGIAFIVFGIFMLVIVANARLSDRFRAEEFRERLRASGVGSESRPEFLTDRHEENVSENSQE